MGFGLVGIVIVDSHFCSPFYDSILEVTLKGTKMSRIYIRLEPPGSNTTARKIRVRQTVLAKDPGEGWWPAALKWRDYAEYPMFENAGVSGSVTVPPMIVGSGESFAVPSQRAPGLKI
jgi:hypothetical protein